jgi:hypothetical protein
MGAQLRVGCWGAEREGRAAEGRPKGGAPGRWRGGVTPLARHCGSTFYRFESPLAACAGLRESIQVDGVVELERRVREPNNPPAPRSASCPRQQPPVKTMSSTASMTTPNGPCSLEAPSWTKDAQSPQERGRELGPVGRERASHGPGLVSGVEAVRLVHSRKRGGARLTCRRLQVMCATRAQGGTSWSCNSLIRRTFYPTPPGGGPQGLSPPGVGRGTPSSLDV